jgi:hypothetical protein
MNKSASREWMINALLIAALAVLIAAKCGPSTLKAAGGGWETNGVLINSTDNIDDRLVVVNTDTKNIAVYRTTNSGQFRLLAARDYKFDLLIPDSSVSDEIEKKGGISFMRAYELYEQHLQEEEKKAKQASK